MNTLTLKSKQGKFEIWLPVTPKNKAFARDCETAIIANLPVLYDNAPHLVYYFGIAAVSRGTTQYHIGLARVNGTN